MKKEIRWKGNNKKNGMAKEQEIWKITLQNKEIRKAKI
jgi:hypothetical protein